MDPPPAQSSRRRPKLMGSAAAMVMAKREAAKREKQEQDEAKAASIEVSEAAAGGDDAQPKSPSVGKATAASPKTASRKRPPPTFRLVADGARRCGRQWTTTHAETPDGCNCTCARIRIACSTPRPFRLPARLFDGRHAPNMTFPSRAIGDAFVRAWHDAVSLTHREAVRSIHHGGTIALPNGVRLLLRVSREQNALGATHGETAEALVSLDNARGLLLYPPHPLARYSRRLASSTTSILAQMEEFSQDGHQAQQ